MTGRFPVHFQSLAADISEMHVGLRVARICGASLSAVLAAALAIFAVASIGAAVMGETSDMWAGGVVMLGLFYAFLAAAAATGAWKLWPRRPDEPVGSVDA